MKPDQQYMPQLRIDLVIRSDIEHFLKSAVRLAKIMDIELEAVFIQDQSMLDAAALPLVQEVCLWTAKEQATSTSLLAKSMRIQAQQMSVLLAEIAESEAVPYSFVSRLSRPARQNVDSSELSIFWAGGRGLSLWPNSCPVCVLIDSDHLAPACLRQAAEFSKKTDRLLNVYVLGSDGVSRQCRAEIREILLKNSKLEFDIKVIDDLDLWLQKASNMACFVLFMPRRAYTECHMNNALEQISFPVLLV